LHDVGDLFFVIVNHTNQHSFDENFVSLYMFLSITDEQGAVEQRVIDDLDGRPRKFASKWRRRVQVNENQ